jgi:hypothetical protein
MESIMSELSLTLEQCEAEIEKAHAAMLPHFVTVGIHLMTIRDNDLYKKTHETFEEYVKERWNFSRARAYQFISGAKVVDNLSSAVDKKSLNNLSNRQAIELGKASDDPEIQAEVFNTALTITPVEEMTPAVIQKAATIVKRPRTVQDMLAEKRALNQPTAETVALDEAVEACVKTLNKLRRQLGDAKIALAEKIKVAGSKMATMQKRLEQKLNAVSEDSVDLIAALAEFEKSWKSNRKQVDDLQ